MPRLLYSLVSLLAVISLVTGIVVLSEEPRRSEGMAASTSESPRSQSAMRPGALPLVEPTAEELETRARLALVDAIQTKDGGQRQSEVEVS